jgi:hypothetical protein
MRDIIDIKNVVLAGYFWSNDITLKASKIESYKAMNMNYTINYAWINLRIN